MSRSNSATDPVTPRSLVDHKAWAKTLKARHDSGESINMNQVRCYRNALGLNSPAL